MSFSDIKKAIIDNNLNRVKALVEENPDIVHITNTSGEGPLYMASHFGHLHIIEYLVEHGANINQQENRNGWTALNLAVHGAHTNVVEYLLNAGADWNIPTNYGDTPLIIACHKNKNNSHLEIIKMLLILGPDVTVENKGGHNALSYAEEKNDEIVIQLLADILDSMETPVTLDIIPVNRKKIPETAEDFINMEDVKIDDFLAEDPKNKIIKVHNSFYAINGGDITEHFLKQNKKNDYVYYPCKKAWVSALFIGKDDVYIDKPIFSASYLSGVLSDFVLLNEVKSMMKSENQYFEIIPTEFENIPATASAQMLTAHANAVGANHCQEGKSAKILKLKMINIVDDAEEAAVVKSLSKALSEGAEESKADTKTVASFEAEGKRRRRNKKSEKKRRIGNKQSEKKRRNKQSGKRRTLNKRQRKSIKKRY
jgi:ankyrin repeat protein